jgi:hypothetical protein
MDDYESIESSGIKKNRGNRRPIQLHSWRKLAINQRLIRKFLTSRNASNKHQIVVEFRRNAVEWGVRYRAWRYHVIRYTGVESCAEHIELAQSIMIVPFNLRRRESKDVKSLQIQIFKVAGSLNNARFFKVHGAMR